MRSLPPRDALLLWAALAVWTLCFALHWSQLRAGRLAWIPFHVSASGEDAESPVVTGFWSAAESARFTLAVGDALIAVDGRSLAGASRLEFVETVYAALAARGQHATPELALRVRRGQAERSVSVALLPVRWPWRATLLALGFVATGALAFVRSRGMRAARLLFLATLGYSLHWAYFFGGSPIQTRLGIVVFAGGLSLAVPLIVRALLIFPPETAREHGLWRWLPLPFALAGPAASSWAFGVPLPPAWGLPLNLLASVGAIALGGALLVANYRAASPTGRRQIKWIVLGFHVGVAPALVAGLATLARPELWWLYEASLIALIVIPISITVALAFDRLFDVNGLISRATSLTVLSLLGLAAVLFAVQPLSARLADVVDPTVSRTGLSLAAAALLLGARARLEPWLTDRLFGERRRLERGIRALPADLARCEKPAELLDRLGVRLRELLDPGCLAIYAPAGDLLAPVFAEGPAVAPAFELGGTLAQTLGVVEEPLDARRLRRRAASPLAASEREALDAMGAALVLPIAAGGQLEAMLVLGEKSSGDIYTQTDRTLLATLADRVGERLEGFDREQLEKEEREMARRLQKFVPGAVREQLATGEELRPGPREVTVLFADLAGYTRFSEARDADAIFDAISRYTASVSEIVRAHGGAVVDFSGDGLMAVFGAPRALKEKEAAALRAASEIVHAVAALPVAGVGDDRPALDVRIGVATGEAYVGSIRSVEREIWCVLGNTTNLAARLEALTRELDARVLADAATARAAGKVLEEFERLGPHPVRGRSRPVELFTLRSTGDRR